MSQPAKTSAGKKTLANSIVALSSAAVIAVYAAGYARTTPVAGQLVATDVAPSDPAAAAPLAPTATIAPTATVAAAVPTTPARGGNFGAPSGGRQRPGDNDRGGGFAAVPPTPTPSPTSNQAPAAPNAVFQDGTYTGTGTSRHGSIGVAVTVRGGKIAAAEITECGTRYPCSLIAALPGQVVARQSAAVDAVTGATDSTNAYRAAVNAALAQAR